MQDNAAGVDPASCIFLSGTSLYAVRISMSVPEAQKGAKGFTRAVKQISLIHSPGVFRGICPGWLDILIQDKGVGW